jgi:hypothetical protein
MRQPGDPPKFEEIIQMAVDAENQWTMGNRAEAERLLRLVATIAYAESKEHPSLDTRDKWVGEGKVGPFSGAPPTSGKSDPSW